MLAVAGGAVPRFLCTYRCDSPTEVRWYVMTVLPRPLPDQGLIVAHQNNTEMQQTQTRYGELLNGVRAIVWRAEAPTFHTTFASGKPRRSSTPRLGKERDWKPPFLCLTTDRQCRLQRQPASSLKAKRRLRSR